MKKIQKLQVTLNEVARMQQLVGIVPLNELSPELRNRAARKAKLDSDRGNIQGLTAAKRKIQADKFLELPSQLKNFANKICDKMQEYLTGMEINSFKDGKTKFDIGKVRVSIFEKYIGDDDSTVHIYLTIVMGSNRDVKTLHRYQAYTNSNSNTVIDNERDEVYFNNELKRQFRIGTQELPLENNGVSQREIIGMLMNLHKKINVELKQSVKQNESMNKSFNSKKQVLQVSLNEIKRMQQLAGIEPLNESSSKIIEAAFRTLFTHSIWKKRGVNYVDSNFVNDCKGKIPLSDLVHVGMGDFILKTPHGDIEFDRVSEQFDGMSGRAHRMTGDKELMDMLFKKMKARVVHSESVNEASNNDDTYFDTTSEAVTYAKTQAEKRGFEIDENDWHSQITMGGKYNRTRPGVGKTNSFSVGLLKGGKPQRKNLNISIYGMESGKFELTYYIN
jgi:hypothetical protein